MMMRCFVCMWGIWNQTRATIMKTTASFDVTPKILGIYGVMIYGMMLTLHCTGKQATIKEAGTYSSNSTPHSHVILSFSLSLIYCTFAHITLVITQEYIRHCLSKVHPAPYL